MKKNGSKLLIIASILALIGTAIIFLDNSIFTFAQQSGQPCINLPGWTPGVTPHGGSVTGYKYTGATYTETCAQLSKKLICNDGNFSLPDANIYKYQTCVDYTRANCTYPTGANHLEYKILYRFPQATYTETCAQLSKSLQCINGSFTGTDAHLYQSATCQDQNRLPCIDIRTNTYVNHLNTIIGYIGAQSTPTQSCTALKVILKCINGQRSGSNGQRYTLNNQNTLFSGCIDLGSSGCQFTGGNGNLITLMNGQSITLFSSPSVAPGQTCSSGTISCNNGNLIGFTNIYQYPTCTVSAGSGCTLPRTGGGIIPHGTSITGYSNIMRAITGQNYSGTCEQYAGTLSCNNGVLIGSNTYFYSQAQACNTTPRNCVGQRQGGTLYHGIPTTGRSKTTATYPHTCDDYATTLTCINGVVNGNYTTYKYAQCTTTGWPTQPVDFILESNNPTTLKVAQFSSPKLNFRITNKGTSIISGSFSEGFLQCEWIGTSSINGINIYKSKPIATFIATPMIPQNISITLKNILTQSLGEKYIACWINKNGQYYPNENLNNNVRKGYIQVVKAERFDLAMERAIQPIKENLDAPEMISAEGGAESLKNFIFKKVMSILVPLVIVIGILSAILGFYKMFFSTESTATQEGVKYIGFGIIGIIIIMSAKFIGTSIFSMLSQAEINGSIIAQGVYNDLIYPFVKLATFLILGILFIILVGRVLTFLFSTTDEAKKKAGTIIGRNIIAILIIIGAQQIVEVIYGKKDQVIQPISNLGDIGSGILANRTVPLLYTVINRIMGLTSLIVLLIIIFQTIKLLTKPDSPEQMKSIKKSLLYIFIGLMVIGTGYLLTNFLIIN